MRKSTISVSSAFASSIPATSANVIFVSWPSTRRARERVKLPSAPIAPPPLARRARKTNSATSRMTGPKPRMRLSRKPRSWLTGSASMTTPASSSALDSCSSLANTGISVSNAVDGSALPYLTSFLNLPSTVSPVVEMRSTFLSRTCSRNVGL